MIKKKYEKHIAFGSPFHDEIEDWCLKNNVNMYYEDGVLECNFPSKELLKVFNSKYPNLKEIL